MKRGGKEERLRGGEVERRRGSMGNLMIFGVDL